MRGFSETVGVALMVLSKVGLGGKIDIGDAARDSPGGGTEERMVPRVIGGISERQDEVGQLTLCIRCDDSLHDPTIVQNRDRNPASASQGPCRNAIDRRKSGEFCLVYAGCPNGQELEY